LFDLENFDYQSIAAIPISPNADLFQLDREAIQHALSNNALKTQYESYWNVLGIIGRHHRDGFSNEELCTKSWLRRYEPWSDDIVKNAKLPNEFDKIIEYVLQCFPLKFISHMTLVEAKKEIPIHYDVPLSQKHQNLNDNFGPTLIKVLLNHEQYDDSIFMQPESWQLKKEERSFIKLPKTTNLFAMSESFYPHGALYNPLKKRQIVNIFGLLDLRAWKKQIDHSLQIFGSQTLCFDSVPDRETLNDRLFAAT
jgi:hypothetical protein